MLPLISIYKKHNIHVSLFIAITTAQTLILFNTLTDQIIIPSIFPDQETKANKKPLKDKIKLLAIRFIMGIILLSLFYKFTF